MRNQIARFVTDESGANAVEYSLLCMLIAVAIVTVVGSVGTNVTNTYTTVNNALTH